MTVLHELIALENDRLETSKQMINETNTTFTKRTEHFRSEDKTLTMKDEGREGENLHTTNEVATTVDEKLEHAWGALKKSIDVTASKDMTNTLARADITIDGDIIAEGVPAIVLLSLETTLCKIRAMYNSIPTLDPAIDWTLDDNSGRAIFKSSKVKTFKTEKSIEFISMAKATKEHPEQVQPVNKDVVVGFYDTVKRSGMITPKDKSKLLDKIGTLISSVKQARQRANMQEVKQLSLGEIIQDFIHN